MKKIDEYLKNVSTVGITGHVHPDGDCVGSTLGLYNYIKLNYPEINVELFLEEPLEKLGFIKGFDEIITNNPDRGKFDLFISLDSATLERLGKNARYLKCADLTLNIDHHVSNEKFGDESHVAPNASSASEVIYGLMDPEKINRDIAIAIYTGIVYDTGVFKYSSTSSATMKVVSELLEYDIPLTQIIDESFYAKTYDESRIFGYALINSKLECDGKIVWSAITAKDMDDFNVTSMELSSIVAQLKLIRNVVVSVFAYETGKDGIKFSLRSNDPVDVNEIASVFGGGGHVRASGFSMQGTLNECMPKVIEEIAKRIN